MPTPRKSVRLGAIDGSKPPAPPVLPSVAGTPSPPDYFTGEMAAEWSRLVGELAAHPRWLADVDLGVLEGYVAAWSTFRQAARSVAERGAVVVGSTGLVAPNPAVRVQRDALTQLRQYAQQLGFTPVARDRLSVAANEPDGPGSDLLTG